MVKKKPSSDHFPKVPIGLTDFLKIPRAEVRKLVIRKIFYDYLFNRNLSHGIYEHKPITEEQVKYIKDFYMSNKEIVLGVGKRVGDIWIHKPEK